ncbi:MAG: response regulator [Bdellovibrionota bacterium]
MIDDSATDAERVSSSLRADYDVVVYHDGPAALEQLASAKLPDLLILDWVMPSMSGVEICKFVRSARPPICQVPIILLTSQHGPEEIEEAFRCGANDYIVKPFVNAELIARVKTLTSSKRHLERAQSLVKDLQRSEERLLLATGAGGVGIWEWDIRSGSVTSTELHRNIFELPASGSFMFGNLLEKVLPEDQAAIQYNLATSIEKNSDYSSEFRIRKSDGTVAWIYGQGRAVVDENGNPLRMVGIHLDITSRKKTEDELLRAKEEAERANRMKSAFLANMSHEIRTPLGAMLGFAHLMQDPLITELELSDYLNVLTRNGEQLSVIIDDILDLSKVEAGLLTYEYREADPAQICREVVSLFKAKAKDQNLKLEYVKDPSTPENVTTDATRLRQILMNLVSNALKFTRVGGVTITSSATEVNGKSLLAFEVVDTGLGVPDEHAERIFDMFVQGDDSMTRKFGGTGIGLALSRQLARELGGDLVLVHSEKLQGSTFRVSVSDRTNRATDASRAPAYVSSTEQTKISLDGVRVLVVDDAPDNQQLLSRYLTKRGAVVDLASNGIDGYQKALRNTYDVVLMDLQMPQMDGYAATKKLRNEGYSKPIIALTAHAMSEVSAKCLDAGCNGYLPKPINPSELVNAIAAHTR